jgi:hypothetical protein
MKTKCSILDYCKKVLQCVSFDVRLFRKEYKKATRWLAPAEVQQLKQWLRQNRSQTLST